MNDSGLERPMEAARSHTAAHYIATAVIPGVIPPLCAPRYPEVLVSQYPSDRHGPAAVRLAPESNHCINILVVGGAGAVAHYAIQWRRQTRAPRC